MDILTQLLTVDSVAHTVLILGLVVALGLAIGSLRPFGISLGVAGVLFSGILFGHFKITINPEILEFTREFGLILFVYTIGMQVGPGFLSSFKKDGMRLNAIAAMVVIAGAGIAVLLSFFARIPLPVAVGMFSGATTNTPSLAAAQQALKEIPNISPEALKLPGLGYAVTYPFGILGIILTMIGTRVFFRIKPQAEAETYLQGGAQSSSKLGTLDLRVENRNLEGCLVKDIPAIEGSGVVISRIMHAEEVRVALPDLKIYVGDIIRVVGPKDKLEKFQLIIGAPAKLDQRGLKTKITAKRIIITRHEVAGKSIEDLEAYQYGVTVTRIHRGEVEFPATPELEVHFADTLTVVGEEGAIQKFAGEMGNSEKDLNHPQLIPVFIGIAIGVILGSWPFTLPGVPAAVKLGLAGGPLIVAIVLSRVGRIGKLIWYMPAGANFMLREIGISLFLACVGLKSGDQFVTILMNGAGFYWMAAGILITVLPLMAAAAFAKIFFKMNYLTICGLLAGSMTDPPALAFANQMASSSAQVVSYAAVYPLVMILRVVLAQLIVLLFMR